MIGVETSYVSEKSRKGTETSRLRRKESLDRALPMGGRAKTERIDLGLTLLSVLREPGSTFTRQEIALWCGCTDAGIYMLERNIMKKLRNKVKFGRHAQVGEELEA